ncbi:MAG TPA: hypothetical protein VNP04_23970, partial [Alphaproteobacteria bacterium]|nr:hypothetical protein [Alphaproteobacteria bacterium]
MDRVRLSTKTALKGAPTGIEAAGERLWFPSPYALLVLTGTLSLATYIFCFTVPLYLPRFAATPIMPGELIAFFAMPPPGFSGPSLAIFVLLLAALGWLYLAALLPWLRGHSHKPPPLLLVVAFTALSSGALLLSYPVMSNDVFSYAMEGRVWALYGANPFVTPPSAFPHDPFLSLVYWKDHISAYGPLWRWIEATSALVQPESPLVTVLVLKGWTTLFFLADVVLVYAILRRRAPQWAPVGALLFGWNPLL